MRHGSFATLLLLSLTACPGSNPALDPALNAGGEDPYAACTDPEKCCPEAQRTCVGSPDTGLVCSCQSLWDCSKNPSKCESEIPTPPPGGGAWRCTWSEQKYTCAQSGEANTPPPSGGGWSCSFDSKSGAWICTMTYVPTPTNQPGGTGGWRCSVVEELKKLVCKKIETATPGQGPDAGTGSTPTPPPTSPPRRDGGFKWPLPTRPDAGTTTPPPTSPGTECIPGQKMWCDGEQYCGWGMVECLADGKWKSKLVNGRRVIDCQERSDGKRPNTPCACYNVYFEPKCCEQANCILPAGTDGQLCGKSGGQLCDYCNAQKPECTGAGAKCVPLPGGQTICSRSCSKQNACPTGYDCNPIFSGGAFGNVCIPKGGTCPAK